jgi:hypothetical protein
MPPAPATIPEAIFNNFGSNWQWASIDYRGVARVHTFQPSFTATGRIEMPRGKHNSQPVEAFDRLDGSGSPFWVTRGPCAPSLPTDRFGIQLPVGADPVEAADVVPTASVDNPFSSLTSDTPKYAVTRVERGSCTFTSSQLMTILAPAILEADGDYTSIRCFVDGDGVTVEWERPL